LKLLENVTGVRFFNHSVYSTIWSRNTPAYWTSSNCWL